MNMLHDLVGRFFDKYPEPLYFALNLDLNEKSGMELVRQAHEIIHLRFYGRDHVSRTVLADMLPAELLLPTGRPAILVGQEDNRSSHEKM